MRPAVRSLGVIVLALVLSVLVADARAEFNPFDWHADAADPRSIESVNARYRDLLARYDYPGVFRELQLEAETSPVWSGGESAHRNLLAALDILRDRFSTYSSYLGAGPAGAPDLDRLLEDFPTGLFQCVNEVCFSGKPFQVTYPQLAELPDSQGQDFLYRVGTLDALLWQLKEPALKVSVNAIRLARQRWDLFVDTGMSQYPWEAGFNGWVGPVGTIELPPSRQWVLLHPQLGVEVSTDGLKDLRMSESLLVEVLGHVWYRWGENADPSRGLRWWGVSAAVSLRDDLRPGIGVVGHYGKLVTLGVLWHDRDEDDDWFDQSPYLVFGVDLFRLVEDRAPKYQEQWQKAARLREVLSPER